MEIQKHIETVKSEDVLSEIQNIGINQIEELTNKSIYVQYLNKTDINDQKVHSNTIYTNIIEIPSTLCAIITKAWTTSLSILNNISILDTFNYCWVWLRNRLKGNELYGISSINIDPNKSLPQNLELLNDRKICGVPNVPDGISLMQLINSNISEEIFELTDPTTGWIMTKYVHVFPNITKLEFGCQSIVLLSGTLFGSLSVKEMHFPQCLNVTINGSFFNYGGTEILSFPKCIAFKPGYFTNNDGGNTKFRQLIFPSLTGQLPLQGEGNYGLYDNLIKIEIANGNNYPQNWGRWRANMALRTDTSASDYVDLREDTSFANNLLQFLSNFRVYIILRLQQRPSTSSLTLTLSANVYRAIYGLDSSYNTDPASTAQTITLSDLGITSDGLTELEVSSGIMTSTIYATWLDTYRNAINWNIAHA